MINFSGLVNFPFFSIVPDYCSRLFMQLQEIKDLVQNRNLTSERASILQQCNEYKEFINLEERLNNEQEKMDVASYFTNLAGLNASDHAKRCITSAISNALMALFNFRGKGTKKPFATTQLCKLMLDVVHRKYPATSLREIEEVIKMYLKMAPNRSGGGGRRSVGGT